MINPTPEQIAEFKPTAQMQERLRTLLTRSKSGEITPSEVQELDEYERIEHLMVMIKSGNLSKKCQSTEIRRTMKRS